MADTRAASYGTWASWVNAAIGVWEIFAPWIWGYAIVSPVAFWNDTIVGVLIVFAGVWAATSWYTWPSWWNIIFGLWLLIAPWLLTYRLVVPRAAENDYVVGILVIIFALIAGLSKPGWTYRTGYSPGGTR